MKELVVLGSLNMDQVVHVAHIPKPGETVLAGDIQLVCGGKGANQAFTCSRLGCKVRMLGSVGKDENGELLLQNLADAGAETADIQRVETAPTGLAIIAVEDAGNNNIVVVQGANLHTGAAYVQANLNKIQNAGALLLQLEIPLNTVVMAAQEAKLAGCLVILDPAPARELPEELYRSADIIKPNETELAILTGREINSLEDVESAARVLLNRGVGAVAVTLGGQGAMLVQQGICRHFPAPKVQAVDTTAAGDSFTAAMAMLLLQGYSLEQAVAFAMEVSGIVVTRRGAQTSIPAYAEIAPFIPKTKEGPFVH